MQKGRSKPIILDVDTGMDDSVAIAIATLSPELDLLGITVTHGNLALENTIENTLRVVQFLGQKTPVYGGCSQPMVQYLTPGRLLNVRKQTTHQMVAGESVTIHQKYLDLPAATLRIEAKHACTYLIETLRQSKEKITLVLVGPLTNIGMALRMDPSITKNIEEMVIMGGAIYKGNRTPMAEANFYDDPEAAQIVMQSGCKIRLITLDATESTRLDTKDLARIRKISPVGKWIADLLDQYLQNCMFLGISKTDSVAVHDAVAVCAFIDPAVVTDLRQAICDVDFSGGASDGQLILDNRGFAQPDAPTFVAYSCDQDRFVKVLTETLLTNIIKM